MCTKFIFFWYNTHIWVRMHNSHGKLRIFSYLITFNTVKLLNVSHMKMSILKLKHQCVYLTIRTPFYRCRQTVLYQKYTYLNIYIYGFFSLITCIWKCRLIENLYPTHIVASFYYFSVVGLSNISSVYHMYFLGCFPLFHVFGLDKF